MSPIKDNIKKTNQQIADTAMSCGRQPDTIQLIAVSKRKPVESIMEAIKAGVTHLGENYIQEAIEKIDVIGKDNACWHFIGHLQSNKAKFAVNYFEYIHTVDTLKLANQINKQAKKINKIQKILLQVNIGEEETKSGTGIEEAVELANQISALENVSLQGLMGMPPYFSDPEQARIYFKKMAAIKKEIMAHQFKNVAMNHLSMGMSNDFKVAIEEGSTMVRVGTSIFGKRD
ncbi:YggS family pyridoxal phosphate-dependent enzyme [Desulfobacula toluolica]|uniref:Pyridoxal phosphate homeostasis protein n=1 Tax=Desulfobacula toluolica (strain DSM 7467 / Tol2) TaxID=651182 RepID=K0N9J5_DESTT|nr:YggS family pyridoxal phosphate-dependent enzyme [Desulfobacula toluolica]CCK80604.1 alanine racemanse [Desulfobacula toluolica Tol2]